MILPTKGILPREALLSVGAEVLRRLREPKTVSRVWHELTGAHVTKSDSSSATLDLTFDWFVLTLDLLFLLGALDLHNGQLRRVTNAQDPAA